MPRIDFSLLCARCGSSLQGLDSAGSCPACGTGIHDTLNLDVLDLPTQSIAQDLACIACGYNLRTLAFGAVCPECGRKVRDSIGPVLVDLSQMRIADDVACIYCGYNLRTLSLGAVCPECSRPVSASLGPDELRFANPSWLRGVRQGVTLLIATGLGMLLTVLVPFVGGVGAAWGGSSGLGFLVGILQVVWLLLAFLGFLGVFAATTPEPNPRGRPETSVPRWLARTWVVLASIWTLAALASIAGGSVFFFLMRPLFVFMTLAGVAGLIGLCLCLRRLAQRARQPGLSRLITVFLWISAVLGFGGLGLMVFITHVVQPRLMAAVTATAATTAATMPAGTVTPVPSGPIAVSNWDGTVTIENSSAGGAPPTTGPATNLVGAPAAPAAPTPAPPPLPITTTSLLQIMSVLFCVLPIAALAVYILGLIMLFRCRRMLTLAIGDRLGG
jgi:predicted RNA-binding Zn-ribbon protein involved in translation (DUF1610 family)